MQRAVGERGGTFWAVRTFGDLLRLEIGARSPDDVGCTAKLLRLKVHGHTTVQLQVWRPVREAE